MRVQAPAVFSGACTHFRANVAGLQGTTEPGHMELAMQLSLAAEDFTYSLTFLWLCLW